MPLSESRDKGIAEPRPAQPQARTSGWTPACLPAPRALAPPHRPQQPPGATALLCTPASGPTQGCGALCPLPSGNSCSPRSWMQPLSRGGWGGGVGGVPILAYLTTANGQLPLVSEADPHLQGPYLPSHLVLLQSPKPDHGTLGCPGISG